ncbi:hypothetical protein BC628DRAFT_1353955 [Trametes gibbosa]|nr:hypothetical protein BC628DRAFT_1353955 [Trametes gibbosa]
MPTAAETTSHVRSRARLACALQHPQPLEDIVRGPRQLSIDNPTGSRAEGGHERALLAQDRVQGFPQAWIVPVVHRRRWLQKRSGPPNSSKWQAQSAAPQGLNNAYEGLHATQLLLMFALRPAGRRPFSRAVRGTRCLPTSKASLDFTEEPPALDGCTREENSTRAAFRWRVSAPDSRPPSRFTDCRIECTGSPVPSVFV